MSDPETDLPPAEKSQDALSAEILMRRRAAAVLEVLGGAKSPVEAAESLGIALPSYYLLEARALEGLLTACEPRSRGRSSSEGKTLKGLRLENERLRQDLTRSQALARAVQRAVGLESKDGPAPKPTPLRRRRATARALRAARALRSESSSSPKPSLPTTSPLAVESPP